MNSNKFKKYFWPQDLINWLELLVKLVLIIGALGAIYQFFDIKQENRIKETIVQVKNFNSGNLEKAQLKFVTVWRNNPEYLKKIKEANEKDQDRIHTEVVMSIVKKENLDQDIELLISFFNDLQACIQYQICDACSAQFFLGSFAKSFYDLHKPWIKKQEDEIHGYSGRLEEFINDSAKCS